jgi:hypothetical protein
MAPNGPEPVGVLVLRAWIEGDHPDGLRVRILKLTDAGSGGEPEQMAAATIEEACSIVSRWLEDFTSRAADAIDD